MVSPDGDPTAVATAPAPSVTTGPEADGGAARAPLPPGAQRRLRLGVAGHPAIVDLIVITVLAVVLRAIFSHAQPDTDATFALVWGREMLHGHLPDIAYAFAPTAHPLPTLEAWPLALLGTGGAASAWMVLSYWAMGALLWGVFRLGQATFSASVGALALVLVATNYATLNVALGGFLDVQFLALVAWAATLEARRPRRGLVVLCLLTIAALLRPEGGILAAAYWLYAFRGHRPRAVGALILAIAPVVWVLMDVIVTGHPLFAFTNARQTGEARQGLSSAGDRQLVSLAIGQLRDAMRAPVLLGGALGILAAVLARWRTAIVPGVIAAIILLVYGGLLVLRLPVPDRMLLMAAVVLSLFCAFLVAGWIGCEPGWLRRIWMVAGIALLGLLIATTPTELSRLSAGENRRAGLQMVIDDLRSLDRTPGARAALAACDRIWVGRLEMTPYVSYYLDQQPQRIGVDDRIARRPGVYLALRSARAAQAVLSHWQSQLGTQVPPGLRLEAANRSWAVYTDGC